MGLNGFLISDSTKGIKSGFNAFREELQIVSAVSQHEVYQEMHIVLCNNKIKILIIKNAIIK